MRRTRLAAAAGVAALTLGATAAAASTTGTQIVTIDVQAAARTITTAGTVTLAVGANTADVDATGSSSVSYTNPDGNGAAKITVARDAEDLGELSLLVAAAEADDESVEGAANTQTYTGTGGVEGNFITAIGDGATVNNRGVDFTLSGDSGAAGEIVTTFTFTITDN